MGHLAHASDLPHPDLPPGEPVALLPPVLRDRRGRKLLLRLPKDLHRQRVASLHWTLGAQRRVGHPWSVHRNVLPGIGASVPGGGLRDTFLVGTVIGAVWVRYLLRSGMDEAQQSGGEVSEVTAASAATRTLR